MSNNMNTRKPYKDFEEWQNAATKMEYKISSQDVMQVSWDAYNESGLTGSFDKRSNKGWLLL